MNSKVIGFLALAAICAGAIWWFLSNPKEVSPAHAAAPQEVVQPVSATETADSAAPVAAATTYTLADVATHNTAANCWAAISGKVYDLTTWINQHPGGPDKILSLCGTDGTAAFTAQHGGQRRPANELAGFYVADLSN